MYRLHKVSRADFQSLKWVGVQSINLAWITNIGTTTASHKISRILMIFFLLEIVIFALRQTQVRFGFQCFSEKKSFRYSRRGSFKNN